MAAMHAQPTSANQVAPETGEPGGRHGQHRPQRCEFEHCPRRKVAEAVEDVRQVEGQRKEEGRPVDVQRERQIPKEDDLARAGGGG